VNTVSDEDLVEQAQKGSEAHFNLLVDRHTPTVYRLALGITRNHHEAEDIVQETFVKVFSNLHRYSPAKAGFKTWLLTIARNQSINVFNSLKRKTARFLTEYDLNEHNQEIGGNPFTPEYRNAEQVLSLKQEMARTQSALNKLPERQRTALLLKSQEGLSYDEIASIMKASASSVESLIFRARKKLLEVLE
jgi:RNA polymerase sigma-70 factor (ECF subfamily)